jgi:histidinol-phosphate aminotransferase
MTVPLSGWALPTVPSVVHGGPDADGIAKFDFSTNGNAGGPLNSVAAAVAQADRTHYPDPDYLALREHLASYHRVRLDQVVLAGSASEFIDRFTRFAATYGATRRVRVPRPGYGDYRAAAMRHGLQVHDYRPTEALMPASGDLWWLTEPSSPTGRSHHAQLEQLILAARYVNATVVLDLAYQPLRLDRIELPACATHAWQLWTPNKACGLTGIRGAYVLAPDADRSVAQPLSSHASSWILGADGVRMLSAFATEAAQLELDHAKILLAQWRGELAGILADAGWEVADRDSVTPFFVARPPPQFSSAALRTRGIKVRDAESMGMPGWIRVAAQRPESLAALRFALT